MSLNSFEGIFEAFKKLKVLVIGDVMVDAYSYGSVDRISPEAPVPVFRVKQQEKRLGGAANVALNIQSLGAEPILCSVVGDDQEGDDFMTLLKGQGLESKGIIKSGSRITTVKHRILSGSQHLLRIDSEEEKPLSVIDKKTLMGHIEKLLEGMDLVIFEDYDKGLLDKEVITFTIDKARQLTIPVAADPKKHNFYHYAGCTLFKPNLNELAGALGSQIAADTSALKDAVDELVAQMPVQNVVVTLSRRGIYYQTPECHDILAAHRRSIADISGAGDTVISIAALALTLGLPLPFATELANLGGGIVCEYQGVVAIDPERLLQEATNSAILQKYLAD